MREALHFLWRFLTLVCIPGLLAIGVVVLLGLRSGAFYTPVEAARMQVADPMLAWSGHGHYYVLYKGTLIEERKSDIIMLGHSRAGQMRSMMFKPYVFTNACITAWTIDHVRQALDLMTRVHRPKVAIFNLDYFMLNATFAEHWTSAVHMAMAPADRNYREGVITLAQSSKARFTAMAQRLPLALFWRYREEANGLSMIGAPAIATGGAFRSDGSALYDPVRRRDAPIANQDLGRLLPTVATGTGKRLDPGQIEKVRELVRFAKERGVVLVGIQLPYLKNATDQLDSARDYDVYFKGEDAGIWREFISPETKQMFEDMGMLFYDMSRHPAATDPRGFIDVSHPAEVVTLAALIDVFKDPKMRAALPDLDIVALERTLAEARRDQKFFDVYGAQF